MALFVPKDRKSLFRQFLAGMYDAVVITDPSGHILEINPRAEEHFGYQQEEVLDQPVTKMIPGLTPEIVQRIRKGLDENRRVMIDATGKAKDGRRFFCEVAISPIEMTDPDDLVFTIRNIERRRQIMELLRAKEDAFNISQSALFTCDTDGRFTATNEAFREMFGIASEEDAKGLLFADVLTDDPLPANFKKALDGETTVTGIVAENENDDNEEVEVVIAPCRLGRKVRGVVGSVVKI
jgi:PAS domain S-box-containing protein